MNNVPCRFNPELLPDGVTVDDWIFVDSLLAYSGHMCVDGVRFCEVEVSKYDISLSVARYDTRLKEIVDDIVKTYNDKYLELMMINLNNSLDIADAALERFKK